MLVTPDKFILPLFQEATCLYGVIYIVYKKV